MENSGIIDLADELKKQYAFKNEEFFKQSFIEICPINGRRPKFWFKYKNDNNKYLYKSQLPTSNEAYSEIIGEVLAELAGIPCAHYKLATFNLGVEPFISSKGVISENFLKEEEVLLSLTDIFTYVITHYENNKNVDTFNYKELYNLEAVGMDEICNKLNNLEDIWSIISKYIDIHPRFNNWSKLKKEFFLRIIMFDIVNIFNFDLITIQGDRHTGNISLIYNNKMDTIKVSPLYDNANIFGLNTKGAVKTFEDLKKGSINNSKQYKINEINDKIHSLTYRPKLRLAVSDTDFVNYPNMDRLYYKKHLEVLDNFLKISDDIFIKRLSSMLDLFKEESILSALNKRELESNITIPINIKTYLIEMLNYNIEHIRERIEIYKKGSTKNVFK